LSSRRVGRAAPRSGSPLVATVSERELAGILAHEFGQSRQRREHLSFVVRAINGWFGRVVYQRATHPSPRDRMACAEKGAMHRGLN
jgi:Zn-dependent protease with chaperone function